MYLKKIIVNGFKSFADKIVISLDKGITGVVGPNGSGKSNVIDAVRWVMGEQNAKNLRGEKATDIIFAGSERRKALGMAEVSLVFDNTEDDSFCPPEYRHEPEISLTRRMYADGQREYLINKKPCRLKDIVGFFATTGLAGRSYSMIQQGQVERILNAKPEDIREILEEAAGTAVFKKRKAEAGRKLEETQLNLSRIEDILLEVERSLDSLAGQVEKAKEYQELSTRLREEELSLFAHNYRHFNVERERIQSGYDEDRAKETEVLAQVSGFEARQTELQGLMDDADPEIQALQEKISIVREQIARSEATLKSATERMDGGAKRLTALTEELAEDDANLKVLERQVEGARAELSKAESVAAELREAIESFEQEVETANEAAQVYQGRMEEFEDEIRNLERLVEANKYRAETVDKELEKVRGEAAGEQLRCAQLEEEVAAVAVDLKEATTRAGSTKAGLDREINEKHAREASVARSYQDAKSANTRRESLRERYHEVKARYTSLAELEAGATDVASDVARLRHEAPEAAAAIKGMVADCLGFSEAAAELSPTAAGAFERWTERVIVDSFAEFDQLVRAAHRLGVGSLPVILLARCETIDTGAARSWADRFGAEPMAQYLKVTMPLAGLDRLVDRLYLLPTPGMDAEALSSLPNGLIVLTAQGVMYTGGGDFVIGGKTAGGLLSRKGEMERLAVDLKTCESDLAETQATLDELEMRIQEDRRIIAEIDAKLQLQNQDVLQVMQNLQTVQQLHDRKAELLETSRATIARCRETDAKLTAERETLAQNRLSLQRELANARSELETIEQEAAELVDRKEETRRMHEAKRVDLAKSDARAQALRDGFINTKAQMELLQNKLTRRYEERSRLEQDVEQAKVDDAQAQADIKRFVLEREELSTQYAGLREENAGVIEELRVIDGRLKDLRDQHGKMQRSLAEKNVNLERLRMALAGVIEQAVEKYKIDLATFQFEEDPDFNHEGRTRAVSRLRNRIEGMGAINMMALDEYTEKTERRDFIVKQRDEVTAAIGLLQAAIEEIEETSLTKFLEIFARINQEFGGLFPILFPGGEGRLELTLPETPLESGVEIMCRLPGKSRKPMSLFSGGEKALTAMALIFALLKTKPTPYCFLDEVDAPLDEANVGRYNRVLEALSSQFQFIVITHNRRTMEVLDTLYGVTMQEPGVSKVVGVDMQRDLPPHLRKAFKEEAPAAGAAVPPPATPPRSLEGATAN